MDDCIFCKIIDGSIPAHKVWEDEETIAFLDIRPANTAHTLIIPKIHVNSLWELSNEKYAALYSAAKELAPKLQQVAASKRTGMAVEGFEVPHAHLHLIPLDTSLERTLSSRPKTPIDNDTLASIALDILSQ